MSTIQLRARKVKPPLVDHSSVRVKPGAEFDVFKGLCDLANTPFARDMLCLLEEGHYSSLVTASLDIPAYSADIADGVRTVDEFMLDYQISMYFRKYADFDIPGVNREEAAFNKWLSVEERCKATNQRFRDRWAGTTATSPSVESVISRARRKISSILGPFDRSEVRSLCRFGPKSDLDIPKRKASSVAKYSSSGSVTPWAKQCVIDTLSSDGYDVREAFVNTAKVVTESRLTFVPKTAVIDRSIEISPRWNLFVQLGVGSVIARRLKRVHIDITDQTVNQRLAAAAHLRGLATLDLSSASDNVSTNLVIDLLADSDEDWLETLLACRVPATNYCGQSIRLEKISGMGNGYTFPLETLIFYSLAYSVAREMGLPQGQVHEEVKVYGDDIIVPAVCSDLLTQVLDYCGFVLNTDKSFTAGEFYESCGCDYYSGRNVRPILVSGRVRTIQDAYVLCNQLAAFAARFCNAPGFAYSKIWNLRKYLIRRIPEHLRCFGPPEAGDGVLHATFDAAAPTVHRWGLDGWSGFRVKCMIGVPLTRKSRSYYGLLFSKLDGVTQIGNRVAIPDATRWKLGEMYVLTYSDVTLV